MNDPIPTTSLAAYQAQGWQYARIIRRIVLGWALSVAILAAIIVYTLVF